MSSFTPKSPSHKIPPTVDIHCMIIIYYLFFFQKRPLNTARETIPITTRRRPKTCWRANWRNTSLRIRCNSNQTHCLWRRCSLLLIKIGMAIYRSESFWIWSLSSSRVSDPDSIILCTPCLPILRFLFEECQSISASPNIYLEKIISTYPGAFTFATEYQHFKNENFPRSGQ